MGADRKGSPLLFCLYISFCLHRVLNRAAFLPCRLATSEEMNPPSPAAAAPLPFKVPKGCIRKCAFFSSLGGGIGITTFFRECKTNNSLCSIHTLIQNSRVGGKIGIEIISPLFLLGSGGESQCRLFPIVLFSCIVNGERETCFFGEFSFPHLPTCVVDFWRLEGAKKLLNRSMLLVPGCNSSFVVNLWCVGT